MSFCGTVAWMAPEVIRNERCSVKVDVWSFGVVLWEILTTETPFKDVDSSAIMWGVGSNSLQLPIPETAPEGIKLLLKQCWSAKPCNRPSFGHIMKHMEIASIELHAVPDDAWKQRQEEWKREIFSYMETKRGSHHKTRLNNAVGKKITLHFTTPTLPHKKTLHVSFRNVTFRNFNIYIFEFYLSLSLAKFLERAFFFEQNV